MMTTTKELICVNCPMGCRVQVEMEGQTILSVTGNTCPRGKEYAEQECIRPMRILTSTVRILNGEHRVLPVITSSDIPLDLMAEAMDVIREITVEAPVEADQVLVHDLLHTGADVVASRSMRRLEN